MPKVKNEVCRQSALSKNGRVTVVVFARNSATAGITYYSETYSPDGQIIKGITCQMHYPEDNSVSAETIISQVIARTVEKYEIAVIPPRKQVDYQEAFASLAENVYANLCPHSWGMSYRKAALAFFRKNSIKIIQEILDSNSIDDAALQRAQNRLIEVVKNNQSDRVADAAAEVIKALDASAKKIADRHLTELNAIYQASRLLLPEYDLPPIQLPRLILDKVIPVEQCKALPREVLVQLAALLFMDLPHSNLALGGILLLCCLLRPSEACAPKFGDILDCGDFGVYAVLTKVSSGTVTVVDILKSTSAYRVIIIPKFGMDAIRQCRQALLDQGVDDTAINNAYLAHQPNDSFSPVDPRELSRYVKTFLEALGYQDNFWASVSLLMQQDPDEDEFGRRLADPTAYVLRRSGCTFLMNCAAAPKLSGEQIPQFVLVDLIMGHKLSQEDQKWKKWLRRDDNWPLVAQMLETIILDPDHSAHPAFYKSKDFYSHRVCHTYQKSFVSEITSETKPNVITLRCNSTDEVIFRLPVNCKIKKYTQTVLAKEDSTMPVIQEVTDRDFYAAQIEIAKKIIRKVRDEHHGIEDQQ